MRCKQFVFHAALLVIGGAELVQEHVSSQSGNSNASFAQALTKNISNSTKGPEVKPNAKVCGSGVSAPCPQGFIPEQSEAGCCKEQKCYFAGGDIGSPPGCPEFLVAGQTCKPICKAGNKAMAEYVCAEGQTMVQIRDKNGLSPGTATQWPKGLKRTEGNEDVCQAQCLKSGCQGWSHRWVKLDQQNNPICYTRYEDALAAKVMCAVQHSNQAGNNYLAFADALKKMGNDKKRLNEWKIRIKGNKIDTADDVREKIDTAVAALNAYDMKDWANTDWGRLRLWSLVAAAPPVNGKKGVSLFRTLLEADYMPWENKKLIDNVKEPKGLGCVDTMWALKKGRSSAMDADARKDAFNDLLEKVSEALKNHNKLDRKQWKYREDKRDEEEAAACYAKLSAKMGITFDKLNAGFYFQGLNVTQINAELDKFTKSTAAPQNNSTAAPQNNSTNNSTASEELELVRTNNGRHWKLIIMAERLLKAWIDQTDNATTACQILDSFSGKFALKNIAGDADDLTVGPVARQFQACNVPLLGGSSGSILEYLAFFIVFEPEPVTVQSVLSMMSALTALGGHGLSEQIAPVKALLDHMSDVRALLDKGDITTADAFSNYGYSENTLNNFKHVLEKLAPLRNITAPIDLIRGCVAQSSEEAEAKMPAFLDQMYELIATQFSAEIESANEGHFSEGAKKDQVCTQYDFGDAEGWLDTCEDMHAEKLEGANYGEWGWLHDKYGDIYSHTWAPEPAPAPSPKVAPEPDAAPSPKSAPEPAPAPSPKLPA